MDTLQSRFSSLKVSNRCQDCWQVFTNREVEPTHASTSKFSSRLWLITPSSQEDFHRETPMSQAWPAVQTVVLEASTRRRKFSD
ncbi:MAG: hypothetical protein AAGE59_05215 [Cyanobacteria bacterium P01_F01_bin.86]